MLFVQEHDTNKAVQVADKSQLDYAAGGDEQEDEKGVEAAADEKAKQQQGEGPSDEDEGAEDDAHFQEQ